MRLLRFAYLRCFVLLSVNSVAVRKINTNEMLNSRLAVFDILFWRCWNVNLNGRFLFLHIYKHKQQAVDL